MWIEPIKALKTQQNNASREIISIIIMGLGVSSIVASVHEVFSNNVCVKKVLLYIGLFLVIIPYFYMVITTFHRLDQRYIIKGMVIYNKDSRNIAVIPQYNVSLFMSNYLTAAFAENKAIEKQWKEKLLVEHKFDYDPTTFNFTSSGIETIINMLFIDLIEYYVLGELSISLKDSINNVHTNKLKTLTRESIPEVYFNNKFIKLFSEDMQDREAFLGQSEGIVQRNRGGLFSKFEFVLPKRFNIVRKNVGEIEINSSSLKMGIRCSFTGCNMNVGREFISLYIKGNEKEDIPYCFDVEINMKYKPNILLFKKQLKEYEWIDCFLHNLNINMNADMFMDSINWKTVYASYLVNGC